MHSAIRWINHYPADNAIGFPNTYPLDSDFSDGKHYPKFAQQGQDGFNSDSGSSSRLVLKLTQSLCAKGSFEAEIVVLFVSLIAFATTQEE